MRITLTLLGALALSGCTAEQGKQFFNSLGSGTAMVVSSDKAHAIKLDSKDQTKAAAVHQLAMNYPSDPSIGLAISPDAIASKGLVTTSAKQVIGSSSMKVEAAVFNLRSGQKIASRSNSEIQIDLFKKRSSVPDIDITEEWVIKQSCWHSDDEFIIGIEYGFAFSDPRQDASWLKYELDSSKPNGVSFVKQQYAGVNINSEPEGDMACKQHRFYDSVRFDVQSSTLRIDSTTRNQPVALTPVVGAPSSVTAATAIVLK